MVSAPLCKWLAVSPPLTWVMKWRSCNPSTTKTILDIDKIKSRGRGCGAIPPLPSFPVALSPLDGEGWVCRVDFFRATSPHTSPPRTPPLPHLFPIISMSEESDTLFIPPSLPPLRSFRLASAS